MVDHGRNGIGGNGYAQKPPHVFLALSSHDHRVHTRFMLSVMSLVGAAKMKVTLSNTSSGGIQKARDHLAWEFLTKNDAEFMLSVDSDIQFLPQHVMKLMADDLDIVAGPYCHKKPELEWSCRALDGIGPDPETGLQEVNAVGTGFLLIKRRVFEKMREMMPEIAFVEDWNEGKGITKWDFFRAGIVTDPVYFPQPTWLSEDFAFCYLARKCGFKIYVDTTFHLMHWEGGRGYPEKPPPQTEASPAPINRLAKASA